MRKCIFVIGPESSGSTLIAKIINSALGNDAWIGRGFNCCDDPRCDESNAYVAPCRQVDDLVCHRSLPFRDTWPPIEKWNDMYDVKYVICTRDKNISRISQLSRFKEKDDTLLDDEEKRAVSIIDNLLADKDIPTFIWSYETYLLLNKSYVDMLADYLEIPRENFSGVEPPFNGNLRYISESGRSSFWSKLTKK